MLPFRLYASLKDHKVRICLAVLSVDLRDAAGDAKSDQDGTTASNGIIHKYRFDKNGRQIGLDEYITPHPHGMFMRRRPEACSPPEFCPHFLNTMSRKIFHMLYALYCFFAKDAILYKLEEPAW